MPDKSCTSYHNGILGMSHIKFWKMASTFTGLKLQGDLGRFGKTEYSDIYGILPLPDEKVRFMDEIYLLTNIYNGYILRDTFVILFLSTDSLFALIESLLISLYLLTVFFLLLLYLKSFSIPSCSCYLYSSSRLS